MQWALTATITWCFKMFLHLCLHVDLCKGTSTVTSFCRENNLKAAQEQKLGSLVLFHQIITSPNLSIVSYWERRCCRQCKRKQKSGKRSSIQAKLKANLYRWQYHPSYSPIFDP